MYIIDTHPYILQKSTPIFAYLVLGIQSNLASQMAPPSAFINIQYQYEVVLILILNIEYSTVLA